MTVPIFPAVRLKFLLGTTLFPLTVLTEEALEVPPGELCGFFIALVGLERAPLAIVCAEERA